MKRGLFIVMEGLDGSGKDTVIDELKKTFPEIVYTREPGGTEIAEEIRAIFAKSKRQNGEELDPMSELLLMNAARRQHVVNFIKPNLERGKIVLCNRFDPSTYAYQLFVNGKTDLYAELFSMLHRSAVGIYEPNRYLFLDVMPEESKRRAGLRAQNGGEVSRFDEKPLEYYGRVRYGYMDYFNKFCKGKFTVIDANRPKEEVCVAAANELRQIRANAA